MIRTSISASIQAKGLAYLRIGRRDQLSQTEISLPSPIGSRPADWTRIRLCSNRRASPAIRALGRSDPLTSQGFSMGIGSEE